MGGNQAAGCRTGRWRSFLCARRRLRPGQRYIHGRPTRGGRRRAPASCQPRPERGRHSICHHQHCPATGPDDTQQRQRLGTHRCVPSRASRQQGRDTIRLGGGRDQPPAPAGRAGRGLQPWDRRHRHNLGGWRRSLSGRPGRGPVPGHGGRLRLYAGHCAAGDRHHEFRPRCTTSFPCRCLLVWLPAL